MEIHVQVDMYVYIYILYILICVWYVYMYIHMYVHDSRRGTRGWIIREETSTYLDSSVTGGALVDSHRFDLDTRKEKPFEKGRREGEAQKRVTKSYFRIPANMTSAFSVQLCSPQNVIMDKLDRQRADRWPSKS